MDLFEQGSQFWLNISNSWLKVGLFFISWLIFWMPIAFYLGNKLQWQFPKPLKVEQKIPLVISLYLIAPIILLIITQFKNESWLNYGLEWDLDLVISLSLGFLIGIIGILITFYLQFLLKWINWHPENLSKIKEFVLPVFALGLGISLIEEIIFRGFLIYQFNENFSLINTAIISSIIFAILHLIWDYETAFPQLPGLFLMGLILVLAKYLDHNSIGLAWGLHTGWIWILTCIDSAKIISYNKNISPYLIGFYQQPLAGLTGIFCLILTGLFLYVIN